MSSRRTRNQNKQQAAAFRFCLHRADSTTGGPGLNVASPFALDHKLIQPVFHCSSLSNQNLNMLSAVTTPLLTLINLPIWYLFYLCERVLNLLTGEDDIWEMCITTFHLLTVATCFFLGRFYYLVRKTSSNVVKILPKQPKDKSMNTMIVIGSGGHTTEMLRLVKAMTPSLYCPRTYVMASSDATSEFKVHVLEEHLATKASRKYRKYSIFKIPRSRDVGQSFFTSAFSTLYSFLRCVPMMLQTRPELVLCNGPGTCVPICILAFLLRTFFLTNTIIVFIESVCRVESLSMTGKILYYFADVFLVQWKDLEHRYSRVAYVGRV